jgi:hypothetical protein
MVAADFLHDPQVRRWLDGVEPAWTLLTFDSLRALRQEPSAVQTAIRIANDLSGDEITGSAVARNTLILLRKATERGGLPHVVRTLAQAATLVRAHGSKMVVRPLGKSTTSAEWKRSLLAILFRIMFWRWTLDILAAACSAHGHRQTSVLCCGRYRFAQPIGKRP